MNDDALPPEVLASSYLDDELTVDQRALVEADPDLVDMVDAHRGVRASVAQPLDPLPEARKDELIGAALANLPAASTAEGGEVVALAVHRGRRRWVRVAAGVAAAAAAALAVGLVLQRGDSGGSDKTAGGAATAQEAAAGTTPGIAVGPAATTAATTAVPAPQVAAAPPSAAAGADSSARGASGALTAEGSTTAPPPAPGAGAAAATTAAAAALEDLGPLATRPQFIDAVRRFKTTPSPPGPGPCTGFPPALATASYHGTPAYVIVVEVSANGNRVALIGQQTCAVLVEVDLAEV